MAPLKETYKLAKRIAIAVVGISVLAIGIVMIVAPGPALVLIPVGLAILGLEFAWARLWLKRLRRRRAANGRRITAGAMGSSRKKRKEPEKPNSLVIWSRSAGTIPGSLSKRRIVSKRQSGEKCPESLRSPKIAGRLTCCPRLPLMYGR